MKAYATPTTFAGMETLEPRLLLSGATELQPLPPTTFGTAVQQGATVAEDVPPPAAEAILSVSPSSASAGDTVVVTVTLDPDASPPLPPSHIQPTAVRIGSLDGTSISRDGQTVTAAFDIPGDAVSGVEEVGVVFPTPQGELTYTIADAFEIAGEAPVVVGEPYDGYTLFAPLNDTTTYLVDLDGEVVHSWASDYRPGMAAHLTGEGTLLRAGNVGNPQFDVGGAGGVIQQLDWEGNVVWEYTCSSDTRLSHHDVEMLPNGNVLMIAWELRTADEALAAGRDPGLLADGELWPDSILEVRPTGPTGGEVVWEWHAWDHLVQDHDPTQANYGVVADHPELIDVNYVAGRAGADWMHVNAIHYNAALDQVLLSVRSFGEVWVIDHSTTTAEAAGHSGGDSGAGGDLLYRWGNPQAYDAGTPDEQVFFGQHDAQWIPAGSPGEGNVLVFNNGQGMPGEAYSSVDEIAPPVDASGAYTLDPSGSYGPEQPAWRYTAETPSDFYADHVSGAQRLPNGNTLICDGVDGRIFEVDADGQTVWEHDHSAGMFQARRYGRAYAGFDGTELDDEVEVDVAYAIVDTGQSAFYDTGGEIAAPDAGEAFYGQDAQFDGYQPSYTVSADGLTVVDNVTGLAWTREADWDGDGGLDAADKLTYAEAVAYVDTLNAAGYGGFNDWRLPSIKELYSVIDFRGTDPDPMASDDDGLVPFLDADVFQFAYGDTGAGERIIDSQWATSTLYVSTVMGGTQAMFGVNFADGRIKGYPAAGGPGGADKTYYVRFCRGNEAYGENEFADNGDGTITDNATALMWSQADSGAGMDWEDALAYARQMNDAGYLGYSDWRLPNAKELQSIVDYSRSPDTTTSAAIDPLFDATGITNLAGEADYGFYWTGTTHIRAGGSAGNAAYVAFGRGMGTMDGTTIEDVHGAGCQRSDPKTGDPADYPDAGNGPQGDVRRVFNFVRLVRDADTTGGTAEAEVVDRHVFYNGSDLDGGDPAANDADDHAIAAGKRALLPGEAATFDSYVSYSRGLTGVMIDVRGLAGAPDAGDFEFRVGAGEDPSAWQAGPAPQSVTVRPGAGTDGSDRITLTFADGAVEAAWLEVTVLSDPAGGRLGLPAGDVFYFGSLPGDADGDAAVSFWDYIALKRAFGEDSADHPADFDRDGRVDCADTLAVRSNLGQSLPMFTTPEAAPAAPTAQPAAAPTPLGSASPMATADAPAVDSPTADALPEPAAPAAASEGDAADIPTRETPAPRMPRRRGGEDDAPVGALDVAPAIRPRDQAEPEASRSEARPRRGPDGAATPTEAGSASRGGRSNRAAVDLLALDSVDLDALGRARRVR